MLQHLIGCKGAIKLFRYHYARYIKLKNSCELVLTCSFSRLFCLRSSSREFSLDVRRTLFSFRREAITFSACSSLVDAVSFASCKSWRWPCKSSVSKRDTMGSIQLFIQHLQVWVKWIRYKFNELCVSAICVFGIETQLENSGKCMQWHTRQNLEETQLCLKTDFPSRGKGTVM